MERSTAIRLWDRRRTTLKNSPQQTSLLHPGIPTSPATSTPISVPSITPPIDTGSINVFTPPDFHPTTPPICGSPPAFTTGKVDTSEVPNMELLEMLEAVNSDLKTTLDRVQAKIAGRKLEDINRRLDIMRTHWKEGKLSEPARKMMYMLAKKLISCDYDEANRLQVALIVNYSCEVSQWMVGIKHVILECQSQNISL